MTQTIKELADALATALKDNTDLTPRRDRVLVRTLKVPKSSVIWVADDSPASQGVVVSAGPGHYSSYGALIPTDLNTGDVVLFNKHVGEAVPGDEELRFIKASDIMAILPLE